MAYLKTRPAWVQLFLFIGLAFGIFIVITLIGVVILSNMTGISLYDLSDIGKWDYSNPAMITFIRGMLVVQFLGLFLIPSLLFGYFSDPQPLDYIGLKRPGKNIYYLLGATALIVALPLVDWLGVVNRQIQFPQNMAGWMQESEEQAARQIEFMLSKHTVKDLLLNLLFIAVFAGVGEELFFRSVLQRLLIRICRSPLAGILIAAFIFSAIHFQFYGFIPRFVLGILLGLIYWYSGSIWPAIIAHFVYDAFAVIMIYFNPALLKNTDATIFSASVSWVTALISFILVVALVWYMRKQSTVTYEKVYAVDKPADPFSF
jgi:uncharacterized protein